MSVRDKNARIQYPSVPFRECGAGVRGETKGIPAKWPSEQRFARGNGVKPGYPGKSSLAERASGASRYQCDPFSDHGGFQNAGREMGRCGKQWAGTDDGAEPAFTMRCCSLRDFRGGGTVGLLLWGASLRTQEGRVEAGDSQEVPAWTGWW